MYIGDTWADEKTDGQKTLETWTKITVTPCGLKKKTYEKGGTAPPAQG